MVISIREKGSRSRLIPPDAAASYHSLSRLHISYTLSMKEPVSISEDAAHATKTNPTASPRTCKRTAGARTLASRRPVTAAMNMMVLRAGISTQPASATDQPTTCSIAATSTKVVQPSLGLSRLSHSYLVRLRSGILVSPNHDGRLDRVPITNPPQLALLLPRRSSQRPG